MIGTVCDHFGYVYHLNYEIELLTIDTLITFIFTIVESCQHDQWHISSAVRRPLANHRGGVRKRGGIGADRLPQLRNQFGASTKQHLHPAFRSRHA